ncbi:MAG: hypothetical protein VB140_08585 [Burkholderia sp.]
MRVNVNGSRSIYATPPIDRPGSSSSGSSSAAGFVFSCAADVP